MHASVASNSSANATLRSVSSALMQTVEKKNTFFQRLSSEMKQKHVEIANSNHLRVVEAHLFTTIVPQADEMKKLTYPSYQRPLTQRAAAISNNGTNKNTYTTSSAVLAAATAGEKKDGKNDEKEGTHITAVAAPVANAQHATLPSISETVAAFMSLTPSIHPLGTPHHPSVMKRHEVHRSNRMIIMHHIKHVHMSRRGAWEMLGSHYRSVHYKWSAHMKAVERQEEIQAQREGPKLRGSIPSFMSMRTFDSFNVPRAVSRLVVSQGTHQGGGSGGVGGIARSDYEQEQMVNEMMAREKRLQRIEQGPCRVPAMRSPWLFATCLSDRTHAKLKLPKWPEELRSIVEEEESNDYEDDDGNDDESTGEGDEESAESDEEESKGEDDDIENKADDDEAAIKLPVTEATEDEANNSTKMDVDDETNKPSSPAKKAKPSSQKVKKPSKPIKKAKKATSKSTKSSSKSSSKKSKTQQQKKRKMDADKDNTKEAKEVAPLTNILPPFPVPGEEVDFIEQKCHRLTTDGRRQLCGGYAAHVPCPPNCNCALQGELTLFFSSSRF